MITRIGRIADLPARKALLVTAADFTDRIRLLEYDWGEEDGPLYTIILCEGWEFEDGNRIFRTAVYSQLRKTLSAARKVKHGEP